MRQTLHRAVLAAALATGMAGRAVLVTQTTGAEPTPFPLPVDSVPRDSTARDSTTRDGALQTSAPNQP